MSTSIYNTLPSWKQRLIDNPSDYIMSMFEPDEWFDIVVNELTKEDQNGSNNPMYGRDPWNKGKKGLQTHTEETKSKMSESRKGEGNSRYGATMSAESKAKIANTLTGNVPWNKGKPMSEETKAKLSISRKKYLARKCVQTINV